MKKKWEHQQTILVEKISADVKLKKVFSHFNHLSHSRLKLKLDFYQERSLTELRDWLSWAILLIEDISEEAHRIKLASEFFKEKVNRNWQFLSKNEKFLSIF